MPVKIIAVITPHPGQEQAVEILLGAMIGPTRAEPGNLLYDLWQETDGASRFVLDELYIDEDAVARHRQTPHFLDYVQRIGDLAKREAMLMKPHATAS